MTKLSMTPREAFEEFGEPCNNCKRWVNGYWCAMKHRQKNVTLTEGHMPDWTVRKRGGCSDWSIKKGVWWHEDPIKPHQSGYGGSSTNILI